MKFRFLSAISLFGFLSLAACGDKHPSSSSPQVRAQALVPVPHSNPGRVPNPNPILRVFEDDQFVQIPAGHLPGSIAVAGFEADKYPVTRALWNEIMGGKPAHAPEIQEVWASLPNVPVTYVNWENVDNTPAEVQDFLVRLNQRLADSGCTYDLPTDHQLWYLIRGDVTGTNADRFSTGVTDANVNEYVTYSGNSNTDGIRSKIQPVGQKRLNAFGIELGNVWKMSKDFYDEANRRDWGRSMRGGSWGDSLNDFESDFSDYALAGNRNVTLGFALVRTCR